MPAAVIIVIWIIVILLGAYAAFWVLSKMGIPAPFNKVSQIAVGLVALYLLAALFFPALGVHFPK